MSEIILPNSSIVLPNEQEVSRVLNQKDPYSGAVGIVKIQLIEERTGRLIWEQENKNLIVYGIRDVLGELLVQQSLLPGARTTADLRINAMQMGTSTATATRSQTSLQSAPVVTKTLSSSNVARPSAGVYVFTVTMGSGEGNGTVFNEVALVTTDNTMLSRQVHGGFSKNLGQNAVYTWTYIFT